MNNAKKTANEMIGILIRDEALALGYKQFFMDHVSTWEVGVEDGEGLRDFAKRVTIALPDWCSFDAFFSIYRNRFETWYKTGNVDGIQDAQKDETEN